MLQHFLNFIGIGILSAALAVATIIANAMRIDKDPAVDGPRALIAEFFGLWVAYSFLAWSFMGSLPEMLQWMLRIIAGSAAVVGFALAAYFAGTPEVRIEFDDEPTGFENHIIALNLVEAGDQSPALRDALIATSSDAEPRDNGRRARVWSEFNAQH